MSEPNPTGDVRQQLAQWIADNLLLGQWQVNRNKLALRIAEAAALAAIEVCTELAVRLAERKYPDGSMHSADYIANALRTRNYLKGSTDDQ